MLTNNFHHMKQVHSKYNLPIDILFLKFFDVRKVKLLSCLTINQRLETVIKALSQPNLETRLQAVNDLENIARDYAKYHWLILEILSEIVRTNSQYTYQYNISSISISAVRKLIQAALSVIGRMNGKQKSETEQLNLSYADVRKINLEKANLAGANLYQINLAGANLTGANLSNSILTSANLAGANLAGANLAGAILSAANLSGVNLRGANLYGANLYLANLDEAILDKAILEGANLKGAKIVITQTQVGELSKQEIRII
jgi:uncharacterized protein YjbI with pentapeptide repeats